MQTPLKGAFRRTMEPFADLLGKLGITANGVTLFGLVVSCGAAVLFAQGRPRLAAVVMLASGLCDAIDGTLARRQGTIGPFGAFLDSTVDRYADAAVLGGIAWHAAFGRGDKVGCALALIALIGSFAVSYTRARAEGVGQDCAVGVMERPERVIVLAVGALCGPRVLPWAVGVLAAGTQITALQRILHVRRGLAARDGARSSV